MNLELALIGAPRSGTSSVYTWLNDHPNITGSFPKETFYFLDKDHPLSRVKSRSLHSHGLQGLQFFFPGQHDNTQFFEATAHNFYQHTALKAFAAMDPPPVVTVILRDPAKRLRSSFYYSQGQLSEIDASLSFSEFVRRLLDDSLGQVRSHFASQVSFEMASRILAVGHYAQWLPLWEAALGRRKVLVFFFEDLAEDPLPMMQRICRAINVDDVFYAKYPFPRRNRAVAVRSQTIQRWALFLRRGCPISRLLPLKRVYKVFQYTRSRPQGAGDESALELLREYYAPWNRQLALHLHINLDHWLPGA